MRNSPGTSAGPLSRRPARPVTLLAALTAAGLLAGACAGPASGPGPAAPSASGRPGSSVSIPVIGDFTGADAFFGTGQVEGMQHGLNALNKAGGISGKQVTLTQCDTQSSVSGAAQCAARFAHSPIVITVSVIASLKAALPSLTSSLVLASTNLLNPPRSSNAFQTAPAGATVDGVVDQIARANHFATIGIIASDDAVGTSQLKFIKAAAGSTKLNIQFVSPAATDDTVAVQKLVSAHVPMIYAAALGAAGAAVIRAYSQLKPGMPLVVTGADASYTFLKGISSFEPTRNFYTIPGTPLVPGDVPSGSQAAMTAYVRSVQASIGHVPDTIDVSGAYAIDVAIAVLRATGLNSSLAAKEKWLHGNPIPSLTTVTFSNPVLNVLSNVPPGFDRIHGQSFTAASTRFSM
jgi:ABC-type branched-subunit amino acid transport system substrate-binding protein